MDVHGDALIVGRRVQALEGARNEDGILGVDGVLTLCRDRDTESSEKSEDDRARKAQTQRAHGDTPPI